MESGKEIGKNIRSEKEIRELSEAYLRQREKASERRRRFFEKMTPEQWEMKRAKDREYYYKRKEAKKKKAMSENQKLQQKGIRAKASKR